MIYGLVYSLFRTGGLDPYLASECVNIVIKFVGFVGFYAFAREAAGVPRWAAAAGAFAFTLCNNSYVQSNHAQLFSVALAPVLGLLLWKAALATGRHDRKAVGGWGAAAILFAAWMLTSFYMAWFFAFFSAVLAIVLAATAGGVRRREWMVAAYACRTPLLLCLLLLAACLVPFLRLYLPKASETGMHEFREVMTFVPTPLDALNFGRGNLFYDRLQVRMLPYLPLNHEHSTGFTPLMLLLFAAGGVLTWRTRRSLQGWIVGGFAVATVIMWVLALRFGDHTLWRVVYAYVPGAKAARAVARIQLFLDWPLLVVAAAGLSAIAAGFGHTASSARLALAALLALVLCGEQLNQGSGNLNRTKELAWLRSVPPPPSQCTSFYVSRGRADPVWPEANNLVGHDVDAMLLAEWFQIPTVNGFASLIPWGWNLLSIDRPDYGDRVQQFVADHAIAAGLCGLDLAALAWDTDPPLDPPGRRLPP